MARSLGQISAEINRQIGLLIHRSGKLEMIIVGTHKAIMIPSLAHLRGGGGRLKGVRLVHTHLRGEEISDEDLMDLLFLRLDMLSVLQVAKDGQVQSLHSAHLQPARDGASSWTFLDPVHPSQQRGSVEDIIAEVEAGFSRVRSLSVADDGDRAILVSVTAEVKMLAEESLTELGELARSANVKVLDTVLQRSRKANPRFILGKGKLADIMILALQLDANLLVFNQDLNPSQVRSITDFTEMRVIDRTQLILDIFASRALSREGKLQVEMAQLKYALPRLSSRDDALSRLSGGIGARGPGETKLELDRRRINDRLSGLARELKHVGEERYRRRAQRRRRDVPVLSLVGYTNAGKSTLLNVLTGSHIVAEDKLFATLDPTSRRLRFPTEMEVIITDTVGFIRNLPAELIKAFMATLEELEEADLLIHVIDVSNPCYRDHIEVVERLLSELDLGHIPCLKVFNKIDLLADPAVGLLEDLSEQGVLVSALQPETLKPFLARAEKMLGRILAEKDL
ncbi:GTPase HflX [Desulfotalea psychrophila]|uniref:GTPase HflX n=1 Tax=Desulfotalea psychrophila (strain LSv54 / DSM 12343) TaxID=177439 RepID=Q6AJ33_DESPS|nr:GTPase HflX [Desulfotalea psychrophila]CAG37647.1 related to GTP-binding protein HflX [Desulfotalea psychrophila LSv54]